MCACSSVCVVMLRGRAAQCFPLRVKSQHFSFRADHYYSLFSFHTKSKAHSYMYRHVHRDEKQKDTSGVLASEDKPAGLTFSVPLPHPPPESLHRCQRGLIKTKSTHLKNAA